MLVSAIRRSESATCIHISLLSQTSLPPLPPPTCLGHHRAPSYATYALQKLPTSSPFYIQQCLYVSSTLPVSLIFLFPPMSTWPFSTAASLFLPANRLIWTHLSRFPSYALIHNICFSLSDFLHSVWQSLGPTPSLQMTQFYSFLCLSNIPLYTCITYIQMYHIFICSSVDGHLGCFHVPAIVNSAAVNTGLQLSFELRFSPDVCPRVGLLGHMVVFLVVFFFFFKAPPYCSP